MHAVISWNAFRLQQYMIYTRSECRGYWQLMPGDEDSPLIVVCQHQFVPVVTSSETSLPRLCLPIAVSARLPWAVYNSCIQHNARCWDCSPIYIGIFKLGLFLTLLHREGPSMFTSVLSRVVLMKFMCQFSQQLQSLIWSANLQSELVDVLITWIMPNPPSRTSKKKAGEAGMQNFTCS